MVYVKYFDILGIDTAQIPCIELQGAPTTATVGAVGLLGLDVLSESSDIYVCTAVNGAIYTWKSLRDGKDGSCVVKAEINDINELILTLSDGTTINAGVVKGKDGVHGKDGNDGVSVSSVELNADGELIISLSNGTTTNVGKVTGDTGNDGVSITKVEMNASYELIVTLSNDTIMNLGQVIPTIQDLVGTEPIGEYASLYYDGEKFVEKPISLADASWETIAKISEAGKASEYFSVGDEKEVELASGEKITLVILGFDHDKLWNDSSTVGITFGMKNLLATKYPIHFSTGGIAWGSCDIYTETLPTLFSHLPGNLQSVIKTVSKTARTSSSSAAKSYSHQLFLFSPTEVGLSALGVSDGQKYSYYETDATTKRKKKLSNGLGEAANWWLRWRSEDTMHDVVLTTGEKGNFANTLEEGICFGFCI